MRARCKGPRGVRLTGQAASFFPFVEGETIAKARTGLVWVRRKSAARTMKPF